MEIDALGTDRAAVGNPETRRRKLRAQLAGHRLVQFAEDTHRRILQLAVADALDEMGADHDGLDLLGREHQRRQVVPLAQDVADAGLAFDRDAPRLQGRDVAIDRARGHFEPVRQHGGRHRPPAAAQGLDDVEQAIGTTQRRASSR